MAEKQASSDGTSFLSLLTLIFVVAKITHYVDWSWWIVFPILVGVGIVIVLAVIVGIATALEK